MNYKPNSSEMDRLMHQVRRTDTKPHQLMRDALNKYLSELEQQEAKELTNHDKHFSN